MLRVAYFLGPLAKFKYVIRLHTCLKALLDQGHRTQSYKQAHKSLTSVVPLTSMGLVTCISVCTIRLRVWDFRKIRKSIMMPQLPFFLILVQRGTTPGHVKCVSKILESLFQYCACYMLIYLGKLLSAV